MPLVSQAAYARRLGISRAAVHKRTSTVGGPIPVYGPRKLIDVAEADRLWETTKTPQGEAGGAASRINGWYHPPCKHHTDYPAADGAWEVLEWRAWVPAAARRLAQSLEVAAGRIEPLLAGLVDTQLEAFGLYADDVQEQIAAWRAEADAES
jgi:hypothetical protein